MVDVEALYEVWSICKEYIPAKERAAAADHIVDDLMGMIGDAELEDFCSKDHLLSDAFGAYQDHDEHDEEQED